MQLVFKDILGCQAKLQWSYWPLGWQIQVDLQQLHGVNSARCVVVYIIDLARCTIKRLSACLPKMIKLGPAGAGRWLRLGFSDDRIYERSMCCMLGLGNWRREWHLIF